MNGIGGYAGSPQEQGGSIFRERGFSPMWGDDCDRVISGMEWKEGSDGGDLFKDSGEWPPHITDGGDI